MSFSIFPTAAVGAAIVEIESATVNLGTIRRRRGGTCRSRLGSAYATCLRQFGTTCHPVRRWLLLHLLTPLSSLPPPPPPPPPTCFPTTHVVIFAFFFFFLVVIVVVVVVVVVVVLLIVVFVFVVFVSVVALTRYQKSHAPRLPAERCSVILPSFHLHDSSRFTRTTNGPLQDHTNNPLLITPSRRRETLIASTILLSHVKTRVRNYVRCLRMGARDRLKERFEESTRLERYYALTKRFA